MHHITEKKSGRCRAGVQSVRLLAGVLTALSATSVFWASPAQAQGPSSPDTINTPAYFHQPTAPFINTWLLTGLFENDAANSGYDRDWVGELQAKPQEGAAAGSGTWKYFDDRLFSRNYDDYQDLFSYFKIKQGQSVAAKVVYAHVYVYSPTTRDAQLRIGADNSFKAWVNGVLVAGSTNSSLNTGSDSSYVIDDPAARLNSGKDFVKTDVRLNSGWNRLLLKVANRENGRFGFYARLTDENEAEIPGLLYSTNGPTSALTITTAAMPEAKTGTLPVGFREWPYVGARPDVAKLDTAVDRGGTSLAGHIKNRNMMMQSADFLLTVAGGEPTYRWYVSNGVLPKGLRLDEDGGIRGTVAASAPLGDYPFTVKVRDGKGAVAQKALSITVRERPNKWYEQGRLGALIHAPEKTPPGGEHEVANLMKRQGYKLGMPISYNNGDMLFRWPAPMAKKKTPDDWVLRYKTALEAEGVIFGMYMGNLNVGGDPNFGVNEQVLVLDDVMTKYKPKALWFDWLGMDATSADAMYSVIKSHDPDAIVILNGFIRMSSGDWDVIDFEGWGSWGRRSWHLWPADLPWPKKHAPESWRLLVEPKYMYGQETDSDWQEMLRVQISLIGDGYIANIDHTPTIIPTSNHAKVSDMPLMKKHIAMADWASPAKLPPLYPSYTEVDPGPLADANWGYDTINVKRDTVYLHMLKNPHGKTGLPPEGTMAVGPIEGKVKSVTWMNKNKRLTFVQPNTSTDRTITINLKGVTADPIDTILKIELEKPWLPPEDRPIAPIPAGNLAFRKPSKLMSTDGQRILEPSSAQYDRQGVDGDPDTTAAGAWEYAWMYHVDLEQIHDVGRIVVNFFDQGYATEYKVLVSADGDEWKTIAHVKGNTSGGAKPLTFAPTEVRYVRVQAVTPDGPDQPGAQMAITELQVFEK
jgi:hypothetical protein